MRLTAREMSRLGGVKAPCPDVIAPQLATKATRPPAGSTWIYNVKLDGYRMAARIRDGHVALLTRNRHDWTGRLRHLAVALEGLGVTSCWLDGEVVALDAGLRPDFGALHAARQTWCSSFST